MMNSFKREERYMVVKLSKLANKKPYPGAFVDYSIESQIEKLAGHAFVDCVVVESDWPEYGTVWKMIQERITGTSVSKDQKALEVASDIMELLEKPMPTSQLKAKIQCLIIDLIEEE